MVICLERGADLHMAQLMPLPLTVPCFSKIQIGFTFLVPAHPGSPGKRAVKRVCVCVCRFLIHTETVVCLCSSSSSMEEHIQNVYTLRPIKTTATSDTITSTYVLIIFGRNVVMREL